MQILLSGAMLSKVVAGIRLHGFVLYSLDIGVEVLASSRVLKKNNFGSKCFS